MAETGSGNAALRRVITANDNTGRSRILIDGPPAAVHDVAGLHEIWTDETAGHLDGAEGEDKGAGRPQLSPDTGGVKIRWFEVRPRPEGVPADDFGALVKSVFADIGSAHHQPDTTRHPAMHATPTLDAIILIRGRVRLLLDDDETIIEPGNVVIQRATNHAWEVLGDEPALLVAVLIDRT